MEKEMEGKEYLALTDVAKLVGLKRTTLYYYVKELKIETCKFKFDNRTYVSKTDAQRIIDAKQKPQIVERRNPTPTKEAA